MVEGFISLATPRQCHQDMQTTAKAPLMEKWRVWNNRGTTCWRSHPFYGTAWNREGIKFCASCLFRQSTCGPSRWYRGKMRMSTNTASALHLFKTGWGRNICSESTGIRSHRSSCGRVDGNAAETDLTQTSAEVQQLEQNVQRSTSISDPFVYLYGNCDAYAIMIQRVADLLVMGENASLNKKLCSAVISRFNMADVGNVDSL